ncbi:uncharacterized protein ccdc142 [Electrophorus electricus]|uniref:uncharacterized protein ccdc142 n=1 Tax=Electrophorus electricus TaxID=8005 RepID=UPI0015CFF054|nr:uncharacterized protein ccdc142 [Electrophorus electricus]
MDKHVILLQRKPDTNPEICPDECNWKDKNGGCRYKGSFPNSVKEKEALCWIGSNPGLTWLVRQKDEGDGRDYANEDDFVPCQNLTSCSSLHFQQLKKTLLSLNSQCHVLCGPGGCLIGCITGLSTSTETDFFHQPQAAAFSQHYGQLQNLYEQRTQLLFLHEFSCRCRMANCFVKGLGNMLEKVRLLLVDRSQASERTNFAWNLGLGAICEELQLHVSHWDLLWANMHSNPSLRSVLFSHTQVLSSMQRALWLLGLQALLLIEDCIHTAVLALAVGQLEKGSRGAFEDLLCAMELYNHTVAYWRSQHKDVNWTSQVLFYCDCSWIEPSLSRPAPFPVSRLMRILADQRAQIAAEQFYNWTCQQINLLSLAGQPSKQWGCMEYLESPVQSLVFTPDQAIAKGLLEAVPDKPCKKPIHVLWSSILPFPTFVHGDREYLDILFQVLESSTDLLAPHVPKSHPIGRTDIIGYAMENQETSVDEERHSKTPRMASSRQKAMHFLDLSKSDMCMELFSQYKDILWREFGKTVVGHFYYQSHNSVLGGVNQWNYHMMFLLVKWLKHTCKEKLIPEECTEVLNKFCSHILSTAAFMHWDEMMCASLGLGLTDKCLPIVSLTSSSTTTATIDLVLCHFAPLFYVLKMLQIPDPNSGEKGRRSLNFYHFGLQCRAIATVQSSMLWVMSKAYQFLASWSVAKFLLITQGDLKVFRRTAQSLAQQLESLGECAGHPLIMQHGHQLAWGVLQLQVFSDLALRIFSIDLKKMSLEVFEQTMPSAKHWRVKYKKELPSSPSDYAVSATQSVIGHVVEGVRPLLDEDRIPALMEAMTSFMEAWMEHILKQKIKFSIQGALQLKQDFDVIRDLIRLEYSLTEELPHRLLSLHVFHQVDSAIVCLLQQPVAKPYMPLRRWPLFRSCCQNRAEVVDQAAGSLNNLETMDIQAACHQVEGSVTPKLVSTAPPESYLAVAQQEWLDLRIHNGCRWKIPGL